MRGGIPAGKAFVEFILSDKKLDGQLARIGSKMRSIGTIGLAATAPIIAGFTAAALTFSSVGSELHDLSTRTGLSVESLSELKFAAEQSGTSLQAVERAAKELQKKGIDPKKFDEIANSIAAIEDPTARAQAAMDAFGRRSGTALLPLLKDLPQLRAEAQRLGLVLSTGDAAAADKLGDALDAAKAQFVALAVQIGAAIAGPLTEFLVWSQGILASTISFIKENPNVVAAIAAITVAVAAASAALVIFGTLMTIITLHPIIAALSAIAALVLGVATYFGLASNAAGDFKKSLDVQAGAVQRQLTGTVSGSVSGSAGASAAAAAAAPLLRDTSADIVHWTRETAEGVTRLVQLARQGGLLAGNF